MTTPNELRIDAWLDQMQAHHDDPTRPADCDCWDCRLIWALDHSTGATKRWGVIQQMTALHKGHPAL